MTNVVDKKEEPNFIYAGFWIRLVAFIIDMIVVSSISGIINFGLDVGIKTIVFYICLLLYFTLMTYFNDGQTLGKLIMNIKVISLDGNKLSFGQVVSRETFGRYAQNKFIILYAIIGFAPKKQSLFDMLSDTVVVKIEPYQYVYSEKNIA